MADQFRVWITFENDHQILDTDWSQVEVIMASLQRLIHGPAAKMRIISEIRVIDISDSIVFLMKDGVQVFPETSHTPSAQDSLHPRTRAEQ